MAGGGKKKKTSTSNGQTASSSESCAARTRVQQPQAAPATEGASSAATTSANTPQVGQVQPGASGMTPEQSEIEHLRAELEQVRQAAARVSSQAQAMAQAQAGPPVTVIPRPPREAGRDWNIQEKMGLDDNDSLYRDIACSVRNAAIQAGVDLNLSFRQVPIDKLANVYKKVWEIHEYLDKRRFPTDWPICELLKQFLKNHRKHERKMGRLEPYKTASQIHRTQAHSSLPNIDSDD